MIPFERLYAAISGQIPDRVPVAPKIWVDLAAQLTGTELRRVIEDPLIALRVMADIGLLLGLDAVRQFHFPARKTMEKDGIVYEIDRRGRRLGKIDMEGGLTTLLESVNDYHIEDPFTMAYHHYWSAPEPPVNSLSDAHRIAVPEKALFDQLGWGDRHEKIRKRVGDRIALIGDCSSATMAFYVCLRGIEKAMFDLIDQPELVHAVMEKGAAIAVAKGKYWIDRGLKILRLNDSVGNMSLISPEHWRQFVFPHMKTVCEELHAYDSGVRIYCHICGNILAIVEDLVKTGIDCIGPLDPLGGFTPADVKKRVQDSVSLMGGVNTLSFINNTPGEIIEEARRCIFQAGKKGGYILGSGCVVPRTCRKENLLALITASERYGVYHNGVLAGGKCQ